MIWDDNALTAAAVVDDAVEVVVVVVLNNLAFLCRGGRISLWLRAHCSKISH